MGRQKLVDKYRVMASEDSDEVNAKFQRYLEKRIEMSAKYFRSTWGAKPSGLLDAIELSSVQSSWGTHYVLNVIVPHSLSRYEKIERAIVSYATRVVPLPEFVSIKVYDASHMGHTADMISIEAKYVMIAIPN